MNQYSNIEIAQFLINGILWLTGVITRGQDTFSVHDNWALTADDNEAR